VSVALFVAGCFNAPEAEVSGIPGDALNQLVSRSSVMGMACSSHWVAVSTAVLLAWPELACGVEAGQAL